MEMPTVTGATPVADVIRSRRTVRVFKDEPVAEELLLQLLNIAVWAPNHEERQPWRFILFQGDARRAFAEAMVQTYAPDERAKYGDRKKEYLESVPAHLLVLQKEDPRQKIWDEDYAAVCCLIQNFQLAAWEQGLGVVWKTNHYSYSPEFRRAMGVQPGEKIVGALHIGYPKIVPKASERIPAENLLTVFK
ncbi:Nitroreductase [Paenibacillus sp. UNCCL117]|uniref:nitroreductase family protein n=1 Tax=unclassified Paenibacillus TaxID=185978 RepID=UPI00087F3C8B|nr:MULTISPECIES: nitroreductase [unclassified Paenibacillus]SDE19153.1 Nitroreductase [Paenibacillus sp. cl123]SFW62069.1 Nitroreductase [Paenibacillus sp. UNCCL117]